MAVGGTGVVLCRLAAIVILVRGIEHIGYAVSPGASATTNSWEIWITCFIAVAVPVIIAVLVWVFSTSLCRIDADNSDPISLPDSSDARLISVGTFLVGLYALLFGIVNAVSVEIGLWAGDLLNTSPPFLSDTAWLHSLPARASYAVQILLGAFLIMGRDGVATLFSRARHAGRSAS